MYLPHLAAPVAPSSSPPAFSYLIPRETSDRGKPTDPNGLVLEAWAQGYLVGSLIVILAITLSNMRKGVLLHKLILLEVST